MTDGNYWMASQVVAAAVTLIVLLLVWRYCTIQFGLFTGLAVGWLPGGIIGLFVGALALAFWGAIASLVAMAISTWLLSLTVVHVSLIYRRMADTVCTSRRCRGGAAQARSANDSTKKSSVGRFPSSTKKTEPSDVSM